MIVVALVIQCWAVLYDGEPFVHSRIRLVAPHVDEMTRIETGEVDEWGPWSRWFEAARTDDTMIHFAIEDDGNLVGEISLHDIDRDQRVALIGYRIFDPMRRGAGIGTAALRLLVEWATELGEFDTVFALTGSGNVASRRIAEHAGFAYVGPAREGRDLVVYRHDIGR